jgi:hypothetical protein
MATNLMRPSAKYTFRLIPDVKPGFYALRAPTWNTVNRRSLDAQQFEAEVTGWLLDANTKGKWHVGSFKQVVGYEGMPQAYRTARALCVLIADLSDLVRFEQAFAVVATEALLDAAELAAAA